MKFNIDPKQNYERSATGDVFTGQQILNLLEISTPPMQAIILLDILPTEAPATDPDTTYGPATLEKS